jgi:hypothetical protein
LPTDNQYKIRKGDIVKNLAYNNFIQNVKKLYHNSKKEGKSPYFSSISGGTDIDKNWFINQDHDRLHKLA